MDLSTLKGRTIDDKLHGELAAHVAELQARAESAESKASKASKTTGETAAKLKADLALALEKLGVDSVADIAALPDARGQADAAKQLEAKLKRLERDLADKSKAHDELVGRYAAERKSKLISDVAAKHGFVDDAGAALLERGIVQEGDEFFWRGADGKQTTLDAAAAHIAATRPHLVRAPGIPGGSGFKGAGGNNGATSNPWAKPTFNVTEQMRVRRENPALAEQLKTAAQAAQ